MVARAGESAGQPPPDGSTGTSGTAAHDAASSTDEATSVPHRASSGPRVLVEVSDTVTLPYTTGMQRVARELLARLAPSTNEPPTFTPVVWSPGVDWFRTLNPGEADALAHPQERLPASTAMARRFPAPVATAVRRVLAIPAMRDLRGRARLVAHRRAERAFTDLVVAPPDSSTVLLDLEAGWNDPEPRNRLLPTLHRAGGSSAVLVADVLPMLRPEWFDGVLVRDFERYVRAHLRHSDLFLCISERTRSDLEQVAEDCGIRRDLDARVIPLGSDIVQRSAAGGGTDRPSGAAPADVGPPIGRYLLMVGTIEPRKNQHLAIDVFDALAERHPDLGLVLVGKRGWKVDDLIQRIESHPELGRRLLWLEEVDDARLGRLYREATVSLTPARYEGLGMTVTEALQSGTPVVSSTAGALPEAGGDAAEYADPDDVRGWIHLVERHLDDEQHHAAARARAAAHVPHTWDDSAAAVRSAMAERFLARTGARVG